MRATDPVELLVVANDQFAQALRRVGPDDWERPTPCSDWDVRALVNHVVGANVRYRLLLHGAPTAQVEATRTVDHLGDDPLASFLTTADAVVGCFGEDGALERITHHVTGERSGRELLGMRILDVAVHGWDLARAIGADQTLEADVVTFLLAFTANLDLGPAQHAFALPETDLSPDPSPQQQLLHRLGRDPRITEGDPSSDPTQFLQEVLPLLHEAETALHNGDAGPRVKMWSHTDPVTVFGAALTSIGWAQVARMFEQLAARFSNCRSCEWEVVAVDVGADFAYLLAIERTTASVAGSEPTSYTLRSTTIFRRENDRWKIVHRHADPLDDSAALLAGLRPNS